MSMDKKPYRVVDDFPVMRRTIIRFLDLGLDCALECVQAGDGNEALTEFQKGEFNLVICDLNMPNMNGLEVVKNIRSVGSAVPILMITSDEETTSADKALQAGVTEYMLKPFIQQTLLDKCARYLSAGP